MGNRWVRNVGSVLAVVGVAFLVFAFGSVLVARWQMPVEVEPQPTVADLRDVSIRPRAVATLFIPTATPTLPPPPETFFQPETDTPAPTEVVEPTATPTAAATQAPAPAVAQSSANTTVRADTGGPVATLNPDRPVRMVIPFFGMDVAVEEMGWRAVSAAGGTRSEWLIPKYAAGHHVNSAYMGGSGNIVLSGHNNIYGQVFRPISEQFDPQNPQAYVGQDIQLFAPDGRVETYRIEQVHFFQEVGASLEQRQQNAQVMADTGEPLLTVITCWPMTSNTHRIVLQGRRIASS